MAVKVNSEIGRTEYLLVGLVAGTATGRMGPTRELTAYPMGKGSGSVTTFSRADGFVTIGRHDELLEAGQHVLVRLLGRDLTLADLVIIGSHCVGVDLLISQLQDRGYPCKFLAVGSTAGLAAARRGECDLAGIHLLDPESKQYNRPFLTADLHLIPDTGVNRALSIVAATPGSRARVSPRPSPTPCSDPSCVMVNRNQGSGTRMLIDELLAGARPDGYAAQPRSHNAVATAVAQRPCRLGCGHRACRCGSCNWAFCPWPTKPSISSALETASNAPPYRNGSACYRMQRCGSSWCELGLRPYDENASGALNSD